MTLKEIVEHFMENFRKVEDDFVCTVMQEVLVAHGIKEEELEHVTKEMIDEWELEFVLINDISTKIRSLV